MKKTLVLLGYMASGKSAIAHYISKEYHLKYVDLDSFISHKEHLSIQEIFKTKGEIYFRKKEQLYLNEILSNNSNSILAVGGGTPCYGQNMDLINQKALSIYIKTPLKTLVSRLLTQKNTRPLVANLNEDDLPEFVAKHLFERQSFYEKAHFIIEAQNKSIATIASEIKELIK